MPTNYIPKNSIMGPTRIQRIAKKLIDEANEDRTLALDTHRLFRGMLDENPQDQTAKNLMVDCLKVAQASKNNVVKVLGLMIKMEDSEKIDATKSALLNPNTVFSQLDSMSDE